MKNKKDKFEIDEVFLHFMMYSRESFLKTFRKEYMKTKSLKKAFNVIACRMNLSFIIAAAQFDAVLNCLYENKFSPLDENDNVTADDFVELYDAKNVLLESIENLLDKFS